MSSACCLLSFFCPPTNDLVQDDGDFQKIKSKGDKKKDKLLTMDPTEITYEMVNKKLREIALARGKKGVDRQEQVSFRQISEASVD